MNSMLTALSELLQIYYILNSKDLSVWTTLNPIL